jgi:hypothetical protein
MSKTNFHIEADLLKTLKQEWDKKKVFPNPYRRPGGYGCSIAALIDLGVDKWHSFDAFVKAFEHAADAEWLKAFKAKSGTLDYHGRLNQNLLTLQRVNDYGFKLFQAGKDVLGTKGMVVDMKQGDKGVEVRLSTASDEPVKISGRPVREKKKPEHKPEPTKKELHKAVHKEALTPDKMPIMSGREAWEFLRRKR